MVNQFEPTGSRARWRVVYDLLCETDTGEVLTYERIAEALGLDPVADRQTMRGAIHRAAKEHQQHDKRSVESVTNEGYRVVRPEEHLDLAHRHQQRARTQIDKGRSSAENTDLNSLPPEMRAIFESVIHAFAVQQDQIRRLDIKSRNLQQAVDEVDQKQERTDADMASMEERLRRLEALQGIESDGDDEASGY